MTCRYGCPGYLQSCIALASDAGTTAQDLQRPVGYSLKFDAFYRDLVKNQLSGSLSS